MTKELRGFINRVRKAQDKIFSGKVGGNISLDVGMYVDYITIDAYKQAPESPYDVLEKECLHIHYNKWIDYSEISKSLARMSQIVGFDI